MSAEQPEMDMQAATRAEAKPRPEPLQAPMPSGQQGGFGAGKMIAGVVGLLLLGGVATGLIGLPGFGPSHAPAPAPVAIEQVVPQRGPSLIQPVAAAELQKAIDGLLMADTDKAKVRGEINSGKTRIGWITVSDSVFEDGDWVTLSSAGFEQAVRLYHKPTTIAVPYTPGVPVTVTGRVDGDGKGITVAVFVGASSFPLAPMQVGTSVQVPSP
jgi:hypothetical protein